MGSGKTALVDALCKRMRDDYRLGVVTNDIFTREDMEFLQRSGALAPERIIGVQTGGCPHTAIREDASMNFDALDELNRPLGAFTARWRGYGVALDALTRAGFLQPREAAFAKIALNLLARQRSNGPDGEAQVPLTAQDGKLFAAGAAICVLIWLYAMPKRHAIAAALDRERQAGTPQK